MSSTMFAAIPAAIPFPDISPELFSVPLGNFEFALRWYALAYIAGLLGGMWLIGRAMKRATLWPGNTPPLQRAQVEGLLTAVVLGVILGGRLGFVFFYQPAYYLQNPIEILQIWQGGMSFHGGLLGVAVAAMIYCRRLSAPVMQVADAMAMVIALGLGLGRLSNFINAELWGRPTDVAWGVIFPGDAAQACAGPVGIVLTDLGEMCARHPSQLYQAVLEGLVMGAILLWLAYRRGWLKVPGALTGMFLALYGSARFVVEFFRQPDAQFFQTHPRGFALALSDDIGLTMGQILSLPMIVAGLILVLVAMRGARVPA